VNKKFIQLKLFDVTDTTARRHQAGARVVIRQQGGTNASTYMGDLHRETEGSSYFTPTDDERLVLTDAMGPTVEANGVLVA